MTLIGIVQILVFFAIVVAITKPVGSFMYRVFEGQRTFLHPVLGPARTTHLSRERHSGRRRADVGALCSIAHIAQHLQLPVRLSDSAAPGFPAIEPDALLDAARRRQVRRR